MDVKEMSASTSNGPHRHISTKNDILSIPPPIPTTTTSHSKEALKDIAFGSVAGIVGKFIEYPFDTVKVRLQSQPTQLPLLYAGPLDCFRKSFRTDGFRGLYRGISAPLSGAAVEHACLFFSYRVAQHILQATVLKDESLPFGGLLAAGAMSGAFTSLFLTPIELIKCKMQIVPKSQNTASAGVKLPGPISLIAGVYRNDGVFGFWHGQLGTLIRETGGSAAWFGAYEGVSTLFRRYMHRVDAASEEPLATYQQMLAGAAAGMSYNFIFFPADTIKSRMQTADVHSSVNRAKEKFWDVGKMLWKSQGIKGLYRGCGITVLRSAPSSAFIFTVYENLKLWFG